MVGEGSVIDSSACFQRYKTIAPCGLRVGEGVTIWRTSLAAEIDGVVEIGNYCYLADAAFACVQRITLGNDVLIASGVTVVESDFHPFGYTERQMDAIALSPIGHWANRPPFDAQPVEIGDGVRIGYNATILKGVRIGTEAVIGPGAVVSRDVSPGAYVAGNPARQIDPAEQS